MIPPYSFFPLVHLGSVLSDQPTFLYSRKRRLDNFRQHCRFEKTHLLSSYDDNVQDKISHSYTIRFSRNFQRFVVDQHTLDSFSPGNFSDHSINSIESFAFLDEAMTKYPTASLEPCLDSTGPERDEDQYDNILAGMGALPSKTMLKSGSAFKQNHIVEIRSDDDDDNDLIVVGSEGKRLGRDTPGFQTLEYLVYIALFCEEIKILPPPLNRQGGTKTTKMIDYALVEALGEKISQNRFAAFTPEQIYDNFRKIIHLLMCHTRRKYDYNHEKLEDIEQHQDMIGLAMDEAEAMNVIAAFPHLLLYNIHDLEDRIKFMTAPCPEFFDHEMFRDPRRKHIQSHEVDPWSTVWKGCGCGLSIEQVTKAVLAIPQMLAMFHEDAKKPSIIYFYQYLKVPIEFIDETRSRLSNYLSGSDYTDVCAFAHLRTLNISIDQIKVILEAMPTVSYCMTEASLHPSTTESTQEDESRLHFLRKRLQLTSADVKAIIKTHPRLTSYDLKNNIIPTLNTVQKSLGLSSRELRKLILRMPSVIGMSVKNNVDDQPSSLERRIDFFMEEVNMNLKDIKHAVLKQPAILQYSLDSSLRKKLKFLIEDIGVSHSSIARIVKMAPAMFGLSLDRTLKVTVSNIRERCDFSKEQFAALVSTEPYIITLSLKNKLEPMFSFLSSSLQISTSRELGHLIEAAPRVLLQGIESSLSPKFELLRKALEIEGERRGLPLNSIKAKNTVACIVKSNPALLTTTLSIFQKRVNQYLIDNISLQEALQPCSLGRKRLFSINRVNTLPFSKSAHQIRRKRQKVVELSQDEKTVVRSFECVRDVAEYLDVSASSIYLACSRGGRVKNRMFRYADVKEISPSLPLNEPDLLFTWSKEKMVNTTASALGFQGVDSGIMKIFDASVSTVSIFVFVSSSIFPKDDINLARGSRKAGGIAIHFPQVSGDEFGAQLKSCTEKSFGNTMPESDIGSSFANGLILCNFPYTRPSRNRCDLYACHCALKVIYQLIERSMTLRNDTDDFQISVQVCTDSSYAWKLLHDTDRLTGLGALEAIDSWEDISISMMNTDLLLPFGQMMYKISQSFPRRKLSVSFRHTVDILDTEITGYMKKLNVFARNAAEWAYSKY